MDRDPTIRILKSDLEKILKEEYGNLRAIKKCMALQLEKKIKHRKVQIIGNVLIETHDPIKMLSKVINAYRKSQGHFYNFQGISPGHKDWGNLQILYKYIDELFINNGITYNQDSLKKLMPSLEEINSKFYINTYINQFDRLAKNFEAHLLIDKTDDIILEKALEIGEYYQTVYNEYYGITPDILEDTLEFCELVQVSERIYEENLDYKEMVDVLFSEWNSMNPPRISFVANKINKQKVVQRKIQNKKTQPTKQSEALQRLRNGRNKH